jgi:phenylacetate-coenzyme A ligase PaaK-like adenylate-forming protein
MSSHALEKPQRGFAKMHDIVGRSNDFLIAKSNNVLHSARLDAMFKYQCPGIRRFRVHQHENGEVDVFVELESEVPGTETRIERLVAEVVEYPVNVQVVDQLQLTNAGKHRLLVSDLANKRLQRQVDTSIVNALPTD